METRPQRVVLMSIGICVMSLFDLYFTINAHRYNLLNESNPIASCFLSGKYNYMIECKDLYYYLPIIAYKCSLTALGVSLLIFLRKNLFAERAVTIIFLVYIILSIYWHVFHIGAM